MNQAADLPGTVEQMAQPGDDVFVVAGVAVENRGCVGDDVVQRQGQLAVDRLDLALAVLTFSAWSSSSVLSAAAMLRP